MDRKALIVLVLCGVVMLLYYPFILPLFSPKKPKEDVKSEDVTGKARESTGALQSKPASMQPSPSVHPQADIPPKEGVIENNLLQLTWTNEGAALKSIILKEFKDADAKETLDLIKKGITTEYYPLAISELFQEANFQKQRYTVAEQNAQKVVFTARLKEGVNLIKTISLSPDKYHADMDILLENTTDSEISLTYNIVASSLITHEGEISSDMAAVTGIDMGNKRMKLARTALKEFPGRNESVGIVWSGSMNKYFAVILKPVSSDWVSSTSSHAFDIHGIPSNEKAEQGDFMVGMQSNKLRIPPHDAVKHSYILFTGPKKEEVLTQYDTMSGLLSYGWLNAISKVLLTFLNAVHRVIPNYGVSIILMTIIIKIILFPLTKKSQVSMFRMQQLQPMINQMKEKYKNDKQRMGKEQVHLFKKYGVNPMSGCLPMVLQIPVFFALFRTLQLSFEMRQAHFVSWIVDLSRPDTLLTLSFSIPFLGNALNILPLIMTGASVAQMKLTPKAPAADPQAQAQQKMMSFMPIMFAFILYRMPSGLTVYWTVSTILSIIEGIVIRRGLKKVRIH